MFGGRQDHRRTAETPDLPASAPSPGPGGSALLATASIGRRYARALLSLGLEDGRSQAYADELDKVAASGAASAELQDLWNNPAHGRPSRLASVDALAKGLQLSPVVVNLLKLLADRSRLSQVEDVARAYRALVDEKAGLVRARVTSAKPLTKAEQAKLAKSLAGLTGKQVVLEAKVDASLVGGVVADVGSTRLDGSLRTQLEGLRRKLEGRA